MSYELRIERQFDAPPEVVFDTFVDPASQEELHGSGREGWTVHRSEADVSVGGTSTTVMGVDGKEPDTETRVYTVIDRPHRLVFRYSMKVAELGRTIDTEMTITFEPRDSGTLLTMVETGFEIEEDRDGFVEGWTQYLETLSRILKARHDT
jgi:uncharacterized protein YndB with AHSA1/START domain